MPEAQAALELIKLAGFPALLFLVWYIYHRSESEKWKTYLTQVREENAKQWDLFKSIIDAQERAREENFQLIKDTLETINYHSQVIGRIETSINTNQYCPLVRKETDR